MTQARPIRRILVPTDFSPPAEEALRAAIEMARRFGAAVTLFHVYQMPAYPLSDAIVSWPGAYRSILERVGRALDDEKRRVAGDERQVVPEVVIDTRLSEGAPSLEIVRQAREGEYDLVVMGTHGRTGLRHMLLGSVADRVVRDCPCPVLTVRPPSPSPEKPRPVEPPVI